MCYCLALEGTEPLPRQPDVCVRERREQRESESKREWGREGKRERDRQKKKGMKVGFFMRQIAKLYG